MNDEDLHKDAFLFATWQRQRMPSVPIISASGDDSFRVKLAALVRGIDVEKGKVPKAVFAALHKLPLK